MTVVTPISSPLTAHEALRLKHAAMGAARVANDAGDTEMGSRLIDRARDYNRTARQEHRRKVSALKSGAAYVPTPALPVPAVKDMQTVKAAEVQESVKLVVREMARMGQLSEWTIIGESNSQGAEFQPLCARKVGNSVRYMEPKATTQTEAVAVEAAFAEKDELINKEKAKRAARAKLREAGSIAPLKKAAKKAA
ncbi:hypothetical protein [Streptomyces niveus]|uniref:hypothetical protein n=1 Tax=Streptomyces niveus TaxID=193462 RepID=UPI003431BBA9